VDALGIVDTVRAIVADRALAANLAEGATAFCDDHFDWQKNTAGLERFYNQLLQPKGTRTHAAASSVS
jgi:hypothetical protein